MMNFYVNQLYAICFGYYMQVILPPWFSLLSCIAKAIVFPDRCGGKCSLCFVGQNSLFVNIRM